MPTREMETALLPQQEFMRQSVDERLSQNTQANQAEIVLPLFQDVSANVPAYQDFLSRHGIDPKTVETFEDFQKLPLLTKENYLRRYNLPELCRHGQLDACDMIAVSSGSTGQPAFWPRRQQDELLIARRFEQVFRDSFNAQNRSTLAVVCFALGNWVGGMYTAQCCRYLQLKGYRITLVTPGNQKDEIFRIIDALGPYFEQVVLLGYPPFLKDVVDRGLQRGIDWSSLHTRLVMAGEVFSEEWRALMAERIGSKHPCFDFASLYGTADAGVLGNETPLSIHIRRFLAEHPEAAHKLFGESRLPTLLQYDPSSRFFETHEGTLLFTGDNGIPLIRYHIADTGGIIQYDEMLGFLQTHGFNPLASLQTPWATESGSQARSYPLPFVYVFGRSNFTISFFGANIYPENISVGLEQAPVKEWVTGKFVMENRESTDQDRELCIAVELAPGITATGAMRQEATSSILTQLKRLNSEFTHYVPTDHQTPNIELLPFENPDYFPPGVKHRYTRGR